MLERFSTFVRMTSTIFKMFVFLKQCEGKWVMTEFSFWVWDNEWNEIWFLTFKGVPFGLLWLMASPASNRFFLEATGAETLGMSAAADLVSFASLEEICNTLRQLGSVSQSDKLFLKKYCKCSNRLSQEAVQKEIPFNHSKYKPFDPFV